MIPVVVAWFLIQTLCVPPNECSVERIDKYEYAIEKFHYEPHNEYSEFQEYEIEQGVFTTFLIIHKNQEGNNIRSQLTKGL